MRRSALAAVTVVVMVNALTHRYTPPVTNLDPAPTASPTPSRRRTRWLLLLAPILLIVAGAAVAVTLLRDGGRNIRYEVSSTSGTVRMISWNDNTDNGSFVRPDAPDGTVPTPWSTTVDFVATKGYVIMAADSVAGDMVTCRIIADNKVVAESTSLAGALCETTLESAFAK